MHKWLLLVLVSCAGLAALAQTPRPEPPPESADVPTRLQKRMELRTALTAHRNLERPEPGSNATAASRQLSSRERAEMREQLRRNQPGERRAQP